LIFAALAFAVRPLLVGLTLLPVKLRKGERTFILWAGLKGAVPILLGNFLLTASVPQASRLYGIVVVVVSCSVLLQGGLVPAVAHRLGVPMHRVEPEPWALGVRLRDEPEGFHRFTVTTSAPANGCTVKDLPFTFDDLWVSLVIRSGALLPVRGNTTLRAGDEVLVLADPRRHDELAAAFAAPHD
jgi:potassium/hydrogen antiporter